jgi:hypothetical protein
MTEQAKLSLTFQGIAFEISGSESFVTSEIERFKEEISELLGKAARITATELDDDKVEPPAAPHQEPTGKPAFINVLHLESDKVRILKKIPGTTTSKRAVNTGLIYLWGKRSLGTDATPFSELRELCREQGCLDSANFASHMKSAREWIIVDGAKGSSAQTVKLTIPGVEKAEELLQLLNGDDGADNP